MSKVINAEQEIREVLFTATLAKPTRIVEERQDKYGVKSYVERALEEAANISECPTSEIQVGKPQVFPLLELYELEGTKPPADIQMLSKTYRFFLVELACSLSALEKDEFVNMKFKVDLEWQGADKATLELEEPIAYDMYPIEVFDEIEMKYSIGVNPSLKFKTVDVGAASFLKEIAFRRLVPIITGTGLLCPSITWNFERSKSRKLAGTKKMYLIIKAAKSTGPVIGRISVFGEVKRDPLLFWVHDPIEYIVDLENCVLAKQ